MSARTVNRIGELEAFVTAIERGGFSAGARALAMTPSAMSKLVTRLEARLGARLVHRTTRSLQLTEEGRAFYERGLRVLADLDETERSVAGSAEPRGRVAINTSVPFGQIILLPLLPLLLRTYPALEVDIALTDRVVDLIEERADIAIRWGALASSDLVARRLGETGQVIVGAKSYLTRRGTPRTPADLATHARLGWSHRPASANWPLRVRGRIVHVPVAGPARGTDGETLRRLALAGVGLARLSRYHVHADLAHRRLVSVLDALDPGDRIPIHAVYLGRRGRLPPRVRVVLDFLATHAAKMLTDLAH